MRPAHEIIAEFNRLYYSARLFSKLQWRGIDMLAYPTDLLVFADLLWRVRPDVVLETGTFQAGRSLFIADQLDAAGKGVVVTVDVQDWSGPDGYPQHPRIEYLRGSSTDPEIVRQVRDMVGSGSFMAVLDSNHSAAHVRAELDAYGPLVARGSYLVVEDTNVHQVRDDYGDGPDDALAKWLPEHPEFVVDRQAERFMVTAAPGGWLRRV